MAMNRAGVDGIDAVLVQDSTHGEDWMPAGVYSITIIIEVIPECVSWHSDDVVFPQLFGKGQDDFWRELAFCF